MAEQEGGEHFATLPPFANERNKQLLAGLRQKEQQLDDLRRIISQHGSTLGLMEQHMRNVEMELSSAQGILDAKSGQASNEAHLAKVAQRELAATRAEIERIKKSEEEATDKIRMITAQVNKAKEQMEGHKRRLSWGKEKLEQWAIEERQREEDALTLLKYEQADDSKVKELSLAIEKLSHEVNKQQAALESQQTEARAREVELRKMEQSFREINAEHERLIRQTEDTLLQVKQRDKDLEELETQGSGLDTQILEKQQVVQEKQRFLDGQKLTNQQAQAQLDQADRQVARKRETYGSSHQETEQFKDELETVRMTLQKTRVTIEEKKSELKAAKGQIGDQEKRLEAAKQRLKDAQQRADQQSKFTDDLDKRSKSLESFLKDQESRLRQADKELELLKQETFKASQELFRTKSKEENLQTEISGAQSASKNLRVQIRKLDAESLKQQEIVYNQEFQLQELEHRIARASGFRTSEEKAELTARIKELTAQLDKEGQKFTLLDNQHKRVLDEVKAAKKEVEKNSKERASHEQAIQTLMVETETSGKMVKAVSKRKEELLLQENVVRLDVKRLRDLLYKHADEVYSLEAWRHQQAVAIEEARHLATTDIEIMRTQLRTLRESTHGVKVELRTREIAVDKLRKRYELLVSKVSSSEEGGEVTQGYLFIKAAQEKEELRIQGDRLDADISVLEREIQGLEATMQALNIHTSNIAEKTKPVIKLLGAEADKKTRYEAEAERHQELNDRLRAEYTQAQSGLSQIHDHYAHVVKESERLASEIDAKDIAAQQLRREVADQEAKLDRARKMFRKIVSEQKRLVAGESLPEKDLRLAKTREGVHDSLYAVTRLCVNHPEAAEEIRLLASNLGLELPAEAVQPPSAASSVVGSRASSRSATPREAVAGVFGAGPTAQAVTVSMKAANVTLDGVTSSQTQQQSLPPANSMRSTRSPSPRAVLSPLRGSPRQMGNTSSMGITGTRPGASVNSPARSPPVGSPAARSIRAPSAPTLSIGGTSFK